jgi:hypothetical protein
MVGYYTTDSLPQPRKSSPADGGEQEHLGAIPHRRVEPDGIPDVFPVDEHVDVRPNDYLADFSAPFHDLRRAQGFRATLDPRSYVASQGLAERLLEEGSLGIVYPSVRDAEGTCLACCRPPLVTNVRRNETYRFTFTGTASPAIVPVV